MKEELNIQEMRLQMKSTEYDKRDKIVNEKRVNVKLPKLVITKFDGTSLDWFRSWISLIVRLTRMRLVLYVSSPT